MAPASAESKPVYLKDEKVFCFHGPVLYEAKIQDLKREDPKDKTSPWEYFIHYKGWKSTWDDWVTQDRLRKLTDDNRELASNLKADLIAQQAPPPKAAAKPKKGKGHGSDLTSGRGSEDRGSDFAGTSRGNRKGRDNDVDKVCVLAFAAFCDSP